METISLQIKVSRDLRDEAAAVLDDLGLDISSAVRVYLKKIVNSRRIPFEISAGEPAAEYVRLDEETQQSVNEIGALWKELKSRPRK